MGSCSREIVTISIPQQIKDETTEASVAVFEILRQSEYPLSASFDLVENMAYECIELRASCFRSHEDFISRPVSGSNLSTKD
ncbi:hypothetical protein RRF57_009884 [Xylaria bambusicola]|uniref:Uncharacterized protein n=1 Tax=Xylaria bambusicola TaxID=326684 RepID=A0AAN7UKD1_9PEZI